MASPWDHEVVIDWVDDVLEAADNSKLRQLAKWQREGTVQVIQVLGLEGADEPSGRVQKLLVTFEGLESPIERGPRYY